MSKQLNDFKEDCKKADIKSMKDLIKKFNLWEQKTRDNGEKFMIYKGPQDFIMNCHGTEFLPDDFRFNTICDIMDKLLEYDFTSFENLRDDSFDHEIIDGLIDIYNHNLLKWVSSNLLRADYVNEAVSQGLVNLDDFDLFQTLAIGQYLEIEELFNNVVNELSKQGGLYE